MKGTSRLGQAFLVVAGAVVLYMAIGLIAGWGEIRATLARFPVRLALPLAALSLLNYLLRFCRWELYRRRLAVPLPTGESLLLYLATFAMVVTPGKLGEVYKAAYLWEKRRVPLATTLPILVAERVLDLLAVLVLAAVGLTAWHGPLAGIRLSLAVGAAIPVGLLLLRARRLQSYLLDRLAHTGWLRGRQLAVGAALDNLQVLTGPWITLGSLLLSTVAWGAECYSLWLVCNALGAATPLLAAVFIYAAATLAGSLVFLPGGLGGTEGTIIFLLTSTGHPTGVAVAVALIVRLATLWLAVGIGVGVFLGARRLFLGRPPETTAPESA